MGERYYLGDMNATRLEASLDDSNMAANNAAYPAAVSFATRQLVTLVGCLACLQLMQFKTQLGIRSPVQSSLTSYFFSMISIAASFRSTCGLERSIPVFSTQGPPTATPHVGQGTEATCLDVSSFFFIRTECDCSQSRVCSISDITRPFSHKRQHGTGVESRCDS